MHLVIEFIILKFIEGSTCFERHSAHHQELETLFTQPGQRQVITCVYKPEVANTLELLMMSGMPLETC
jgi:hypothetical protein